MTKEDKIEMEGTIVQALPNAMFKVKVAESHEVLAQVSGKMRMNFIKIMPGDTVTVEISAYDLNRGRITFRGTKKKDKKKDESNKSKEKSDGSEGTSD